MQMLGQYLKSEREKKGIRLEEIASSTKINIQNLVLMEEDRWRELPQEPFIRGFITAYARYLGLSSKHALQLYYQSQQPERQNDTEISQTTSDSPPDTQSSSSQSPTSFAPTSQTQFEKLNPETSKQTKIVAIVLLGVLVAGFFVSKLFSPLASSSTATVNETTSTIPLSVTKPSVPETSTSSSLPSQDSGSSTSTTEITTSSTISTQSSTVPSTTSSTSPQTSTTTSTTVPSAEVSPAIGVVTASTQLAETVQSVHNLTIQVKFRTWSKIVIDDEPPKETHLEAGSQVQYQAKKKIKLVLGNSSGTQVFYNGQETKGKRFSGTIRYYIFPIGATFPQDKPKDKDSEENATESENVPNKPES